MGGLTKHVPITKCVFCYVHFHFVAFLPLDCFWSKGEILTDSWFYLPIFAIVAWNTTGLTHLYVMDLFT